MLDYKAIGRRIAFYRRSKNITQSKLAEKLDKSVSYISQIECGNTKVSLHRLDTIADALSVDIASLIADSDSNSPTFGNSELIEIINGWDSRKKDFLLYIIRQVDRYYCQKSESDSQ